MNLASNSVVSEALDITFPEGSKDLNLGLLDVVGLAVRNNPKRAHLLVSKILGKHIPTDPKIVTIAGRLLGCMVGNVLDGEEPETDLGIVGEDLKAMLNDGATVDYDLGSNRLYDALTIGYAETATSLGFLVAQTLKTPYIHSTRYYTETDEAYGQFEEEHSHATSHHLIPKDRALLDNKRTIILVDDEISTGLTLMNTIEELQSIAPHRSYIVAALIDCRTAENIRVMESFAQRLNVDIDVVALSHGEVHVPNDVLVKGAEFIQRIEAEKTENAEEHELPNVDIIDVDLPKFSHLYHGISNTEDYENLASAIALSFDTEEYRNILFLGLEESMALPLLISERLSGKVRFSTTTRSPVIPYDHEGYAIRSAIKFQVPVKGNDTPDRFAYNLAGGFDEIIIISEPGQEIHDIINGEGDLIHALAGITDAVTIVNLKEETE